MERIDDQRGCGRLDMDLHTEILPRPGQFDFMTASCKNAGMERAIIFTSITLLHCSASLASETGFFVNASAGRATAHTVAPSGWSANDADTSWSVGGGYRINRYFGVEGGYRDFGSRNIQGGNTFSNVMLHITRSGANIPLNFGTVSSQSRSTADVTAWTVGGFAAYPLTQSVDVTARAGWFRWRSKWSASSVISWSDGVTVGSESIAASGTNTGTEPYWGAGLSYSINKATTLGLNWTRFKSASSNTNDADVFDVGVSFRF
jgi:hypothetical protein